MKRFYTLMMLALTLTSFAQPPAGYYNNATGTGFTLKTQLKTIITNNHADQGYNALWTLYTNQAFRDNYYESNGTLLDMYSENPAGTDSYEYGGTSDQCGNYNSEGDCYNREHLVPQSYFEDYQVNPMKNDPFHVVPSDGWVNGQRGNLPFGPVGSPTYTSSNGTEKGPNSNTGYAAGFSGVVFEPIDEFKGDVARSLLYFGTRYEDFMDNFYNAADGTSTQAKVMFDGSTNKVFSDPFLSILLSWHQSDPVSVKEVAINNAIYNFQGNRNPYIDHPEYACQIWAAACQSLSTDQYAVTFDVAIYPNPATGNVFYIYSETAISRYDVINLNGQIVRQQSNPQSQDSTYEVSDLPSGFYFIRLNSESGSVIKKVIVR